MTPYSMSYQTIIFVVENYLGGGVSLEINNFSKKCLARGSGSKSLDVKHVVRYIAGAVFVEALRIGLNHFLSASEEKKQNSGLERDTV